MRKCLLALILQLNKKANFMEKLVKFRLSQSRQGRTSVGTTSLNSGKTMEMIMNFMKRHTPFLL